ncbi:unnamed protein product (macronuclear) [Paramecium tetraurelia]|uniref:Uncharacterized protein n=1 Tax=Paramecium tetraurelia TaxID=5888 RepID=A0DX56_PARTE|nr:uncharacterized protein GSPATT00021255001 [Paramecium tetraurelia]CAK87623.1 unnamed protein product [Paramecium tetraurelia]|eukprot:XP_001455020.1 hypothetical protein (macronuclear) [Paramecium tetraurelia strain d4-2]
MRFLIVNGFNASASCAKAFEYFRNSIQCMISKQREVADTECEYHFRDRHSLDDFLYEPETSLIRMEYGQKFNSIDIVFIIASPNSKPWNPNMRKIITLIRMCLKTKKLLFSTSFGAQAIAYLCSTNFSLHASITNNHGEGCKLVDFPKYTLQALKNGPNEYFLDSTTGDLYLYSKVTDEWLPKANIGLHNRRDAMEYQSIGKYIVKSPTYKPKQNMLANQNEMICQIKKQFLHHWLFRGVAMEFAITSCNQWDIHAITFTNPEKKFNSLAEHNLRGPLIIESDNIIATMFELEPKQKDTVKILQNFIDNAVKLIRFNNSYNLISITNEKYFSGNKGLDNIEIILQQKKKIGNLNPEDLLKRQQKNFMLEYRKLLNTAIQETERDKIFHVGFSVKKDRLPDFVQQNNIQEKNYKVVRRKSFQVKKAQFLRQQSQINVGGDDDFQMKDLQDEAQKKPLPFQRVIATANNSKRLNSKKYSNPKTPNTIEKEDYEIQEFEIKWMSQTGVRKILHPTLEDEFLGSNKTWVPGFLSKDKLKSNSIVQSQRGQHNQNNRFHTDSLVG